MAAAAADKDVKSFPKITTKCSQCGEQKDCFSFDEVSYAHPKTKAKTFCIHKWCYSCLITSFYDQCIEAKLPAWKCGLGTPLEADSDTPGYHACGAMLGNLGNMTGAPKDLRKQYQKVMAACYNRCQRMGQCPKCKKSGTRADPTQLWMRCPDAKCNTDFCFYCSSLVVGTKCSKGCTKDPWVDILANCPVKDLGENKNVPDTRACPRCGAVQAHDFACKHVLCRLCLIEYCQVCLQRRLPNRLWPESCGIYSTKCNLHPPQTVIPIMGFP